MTGRNPTAQDLLEHAETAVSDVVRKLVGNTATVVLRHLPSITNYVATVSTSAETQWVAKYAILDTSLVSLTRGLKGDWQSVLQKQASYLTGLTLVDREREQLRFLSEETALRVPEVIGCIDGVLLTRFEKGPTAADILLNHRDGSHQLLHELHRVGRSLYSADQRELPQWVTAEPHANIADTFARKFMNPKANEFVMSLGQGRFNDARRSRLTQRFQAAVPTLIALSPAVAQTIEASRGLAFGDLKPEHLIRTSDQSIQFIDPNLQLTSPLVDVAKFLSRTALLLATSSTSPAQARQVTSAATEYADRAIDDICETSLVTASRARSTVTTMWGMDTANLLSTCLSIPVDAGLAWPKFALTLSRNAPAVADLLSFIADTCKTERRTRDPLISCLRAASEGAYAARNVA